MPGSTSSARKPPIVVDLASLYGGILALGSAPIGGLRAELVLPGI